MITILNWLKEQQISQKADLRLDSRDIQTGDVFVACKGTSLDGTQFIQKAIEQGAAAVLVEPHDNLPEYSVPVLVVPNLRAQLGELADEWYGKPSASVAVIAITGTNGKTSCANWVAKALNLNNVSCATIGTLGTILPNGENLGGSLTTPDVLSMHRLLAQLKQLNISAVTVEASSIGLVQGRMDGVRIKIAGFTNLTLDHLDFHQTMQEYERCKNLLFQWPNLAHAVINLDDEAGQRMYANSQARNTLGYSLHNNPDALILAKKYLFADYGLSFELSMPDGDAQVITRLVGEHNISNLLLTAGILKALGWGIHNIATKMALLEAVPGRLEVVQPVSGMHLQGLPLVVVDYSHTPDSLEHALKALRPSAQALGGELVCVFGCGGDRDSVKRPIMGKIAAEKADRVYVTSDNPRTEKPHSILQQILAGMPKDTVSHTDRAYVILQAVLKAQPKDVILIAGKGHETYQEVNHERHAFDDRLWALLGLMMRSGAKVQTDSRLVKEGDIFIALAGDNFDAHDFLADVAEKGALAAVVSKHQPTLSLPQILVDNTEKALQVMAKAWRTCFNLPVIAVAGSNGKTTTKEMVAAILAAHVGEEHCLATQGNLNNHIGVPLSVLKLNTEHHAAVFELGMNHPGEIAVLADIAQARVAIVTNAQREHQEFMKTVEAVAHENGEVFKALPEHGIAVYPSDEEFTPVWDSLAAKHTRILFGAEFAHVYATEIKLSPVDTHFMLNYEPVPGLKREAKARVPVHLSIPGAHNVRNALAAAASALAIKVPLATIAQGLNEFKAVKGRMQGHALANGTYLIDDSYNANPDSVIAAIDVLSTLPQPSVLVLGDMGEVGEDGPQMHADVGAYSQQKAIPHLLCLGEATKASAQAYGAEAKHFDNHEELVKYLQDLDTKTILVKGSRFMRMERIVEAILLDSAKLGQ